MFWPKKQAKTNEKTVMIYVWKKIYNVTLITFFFKFKLKYASHILQAHDLKTRYVSNFANSKTKNQIM